MQSITVAKGNTIYIAEGNCLVDRKTMTLLRGCDTSVIPSYVLVIGEYAFYECQALTELVIPNSVTRIEDHAFVGCANLTPLILPRYLVYIGESFTYCTSLTTITMYSSVQTFDARAFADCKNLNTVTFFGTMQQWNAIQKKYAWNYGIKNCTVICTDGSFQL